MRHKEHFRTAVYATPFHPRTAPLNILNEWHRWKDYTVADAFFDEALEYAAIRNACAVFDLTPMTKHRITGPDALAFLNRFATRDVARIKPGKVGYAMTDGVVVHAVDPAETTIAELLRQHSEPGPVMEVAVDQRHRARGSRLRLQDRQERAAVRSGDPRGILARPEVAA